MRAAATISPIQHYFEAAAAKLGHVVNVLEEGQMIAIISPEAQTEHHILGGGVIWIKLGAGDHHSLKTLPEGQIWGVRTIF